MVGVFVIFAIISCSLAEFDPIKHHNWKLLNNDICGIGIGNRIIGGDLTQLGEFPWMARLIYYGSKNLTYLCSGSILNKRYIVTAGHCVAHLGKGVKVYEVVIGDWNTKTDRDCENGVCSGPNQIMKASEIIRHPAYDDLKLKNDIALIRVEKDIKFNAYVRPICMVRGSLMHKDLLGKDTIAAGWGVTDYRTKERNHKLFKVHLQVLNKNRCDVAFPYNDFDGHKQLCAGGQVGKDTCRGDSGGPLMMVAAENGPTRVYLVGIISYGDYQCGHHTIPAAYTRLTFYAKWILDTIRE